MFKGTDKYMVLAAVCMLTFSACSSDDALSSADKEGGGKTPIELTVGIAGASPSVITRGANNQQTRSVVTNDVNTSAVAFSQYGTSLYMVIKSEDGSGNNDNYTRTIGFAQTYEDATHTTVDFADSYRRYWEDGQSTNTRQSQLSIYSACVPNYYLAASVPSGMTATSDATVDGTVWTVGGSSDYGNTWASDKNATTISWPMRTGDDASVSTQTANFITSQDLCFSNNVSASPGDGQITFNSSTKTFNSARLVFYHALTWVTFKIKKGDGFGTGTDVFKFTESGKNIVLTGFNTSGTFDITQGEFQASPGTATINKLAPGTAETGFDYVLHALMLPGTDLNNETAGTITFTIDNNEYRLSKKNLMDALSGKKLSDNSTAALDGTSTSIMRPGVHYVFEMTVGKQKMGKLTAAVVPWETVTADEMTPTNARITVSLLDNGSRLTGDAQFDLYRLANTNNGDYDDSWTSYDWETGYVQSNDALVNKALLTETSTAGVYTASDAKESTHPAWYWPNNKTFYHFRAVKPKDHTVTYNAANDYISLQAGSPYTDVCWGAPFYATTEKLYYDSYSSSGTNNGFAKKSNKTDYQISKAIGPTTGTINMELFHMMSDVTIQLTTTDDDSKVTLTGATLNFTNTYSDAIVYMGNGLVIPGATINSSATGTIDTDFKWNYGFIPQLLKESDSKKVVLVITTTDNNKYEVDMADVVASVNNALIANLYTETGSNTGKYKIDKWYPNFKYTYTFKLKKSSIAEITATLANWESINADEQVVVIK